MKKFVQTHQCILALAFAITASCGSGTPPESEFTARSAPPERPSPTAVVKSEKAANKKPTAGGSVKLPALPTPVELPAVTERSSLLQRLPKSALFVLRLPRVEKLREAYSRSAIRQWVEQPETAAQRDQLHSLTAQLEGELRATFPDLDALREQFETFQGEAVFAVVSMDIAALTSKSTTSAMPFTCALMFDALDRAPEFDALVTRALLATESTAHKDKHAVVRVERETIDASHWRIRVTSEAAEIDAIRDEGQFCLHIGPGGGVKSEEHPLLLHETERSFLAADIARGTKDLSVGGGVPVFEAFVNLEPVWGAVELLAPADLKNVLTGFGATSIRGFSAVLALGKTGIDEEIFFMSPGGKDLLTRCVTNRPLEAGITRYLPEDASSATISTFDFNALFEGVTKLLPEAGKRGLESSLREIKKSGFDLRADLIDNIGPTFAVTGDFDPAQILQGDDSGRPSSFTIVAQLRDGARLRGVIDALLDRMGARSSVQSKDIHGFKAYGMAALPVPGPDGRPAFYIEPHWYIGDDAFVFSLSRQALARSLAAAWNPENRGPRAIADALARETGAFSVGVSAIEGGRATSPTIGRRTSIGLELSTKEGTGNMTGYSFLTFGGMAAAVAVPAMLTARKETDENAAASALRSIAAAEKEFRTKRFMDADADGEGEFATLAELCGATQLRNGQPALASPLLPVAMAPGEDGLARQRGYVFRVDLSNRLTRRIDFDEKEFFAYAWPEEKDGLPRKVFAIDADGTVFVTDNDAPEQGYVGVERMPKPDAAKRVKTGGSKAAPNVPRCLDGGIWR